MGVPGFAFPVEPVPGAGVVEPGCVADGAGLELGVLLPEPVAGALPVPVLPPLLCASAGAAIAATIASVARLLMTRDVIACSPGSYSLPPGWRISRSNPGRIALMNAFWMRLTIAWNVLV